MIQSDRISVLFYKGWCPFICTGAAVTILGGEFFTRRLLLAFPFIAAALFGASLASIRVQDGAVSYRRLLRWKRIPWDRIRSAQVQFSPVGSLRLTRFLLPWGRLYFVLEPQQTQAVVALLQRKDKQHDPECQNHRHNPIADKLAKARSIAAGLVGLLLYPLLRVFLPHSAEPFHRHHLPQPTLILVQQRIWILLQNPYVGSALGMTFLLYAVFRYRDRNAWVFTLLAGTTVSWLLLLLLRR